ncbi:MAG: hypothetical protein ACRCV6_05020 [Formosimonas sp.]
MQEDELIELVDKVTTLMEKYHRGTDKVGQTYAQTAQRLQHVLETCPKTIDKSITDGLHRFEASSERITTKTLNQFQKKMDDLLHLNKILTWKMLVIAGVTALTLALGVMFLIPHYYAEIQRYQVGADIQKRYAESDVTLCGKQLCGKMSQNAKKGEYAPIDLK